MRYSRMTPAALAVVTAAFTLGVQPTGLIAVAALVAGGRPILRILVRRHRVVGTWPLVAPMLAAGTVILTVVFADQTLSTVLEATRIRTAIGPSQAWYTENLRYYYLILPTVDGSLSRRFGFLITALCLFTAVFIMLRRKRVPGVARGPAWRLMGVIFGTMFFLMFTPTKWVHHFGLFAAVGAAMAALTTVLVSPKVLHWSRNRMAFLAALMFVLALCFATTNGWWYVSSYGVPFNTSMPKIGGIINQHNIFRAVRRYRCCMRPGCTSRHQPWRGSAGACADRGAYSPRGGLHGVGVHRVDGDRHRAAVPDLLQRLGQPARVQRRLRSGRRRTGRAGQQRRLHGAAQNWGAGQLRSVGPAGWRQPDGIHAQRSTGPNLGRVGQGDVSAEQPGTDYDWDAPTKLKTPGINASTVPLPYGLDPQRVPLAGSYTTGAQQQSRLTSAWYQLPKADAGHPLVVVTAAGNIAGNSILHHHTNGQTGGAGIRQARSRRLRAARRPIDAL